MYDQPKTDFRLLDSFYFIIRILHFRLLDLFYLSIFHTTLSCFRFWFSLYLALNMLIHIKTLL